MSRKGRRGEITHTRTHTKKMKTMPIIKEQRVFLIIFAWNILFYFDFVLLLFLNLNTEEQYFFINVLICFKCLQL